MTSAIRLISNNVMLNLWLLLLAVMAQQSLSVAGGLIDDRYSIPDGNDRNWNSAYNNVNFETVSNLDLDTKTILARLASESTDGLDAAKKVFEAGAFADALALLKIADPAFFNLNVPPGTPVIGTSTAGTTIEGTVNFGSNIGNDTLEVHYALGGTSGVCSVGGNPSPTTSGCFASSGSISFSIQNNGAQSFEYTYDPFEDNSNGISLASLDLFRDVTISQTYMNKFLDYYSDPFYDKEWIRSAFAGTSTQGDKMDFQNFGLEGRAAAIRLGIVVFRTWMFVVNSVEDAVFNCGVGVPSETDRWDQAVAAYTGSELIATGGGGYFLYTLAETECINFGTCKKDTVIAPMNEEIFSQFREGKGYLQQGKCANARENAKNISKLMTIPLIQGILRLTHDLDLKNKFQESTQGQVAAYAAVILPLMHSCSAGNAVIIYDDLAPGNAVSGSFEVVKAALERSYDCLGVTCEQIGGLLNLKGDGYEFRAEPCGISTSSVESTPTQAFSPTRQPTVVSVPGSSSNKSDSYASSYNSQQLAIGLSIGAIIVAALIAIVVGVVDHKRNKQFDTSDGGMLQMPAGESKTGGLDEEGAVSAENGARRGIV